MKSLPYFSRPQQGIILLLGAALLLLWAWRANFFRPPSPAPANRLRVVFVEVSGPGAHPGVYSFDHPPTLAEVWQKCGAKGNPRTADDELHRSPKGPSSYPLSPQRGERVRVRGDEKQLSAAIIASGTRLEIKEDGHYQLLRLHGAELLTLGLPIDLNTATAADLDALPGVGPALAQKIVEYRQQHGPFSTIEAVAQVSGIGPKLLDKIKPFLVIARSDDPIDARR